MSESKKNLQRNQGRRKHLICTGARIYIALDSSFRNHISKMRDERNVTY
jgi:hypothetical protein